jgi:hypothetical protein
MAISSDRIVKKFYISGNQDYMPGASEGFDTFEEALDRVNLRQQPGNSAEVPMYIFETFVVAPPAS